MPYFTVQDWLLGPALIFSACGIILFRRHRTPALALVAIGFTATLLAGVGHFIAYYEFSRLYQSTGTLTATDVKPYGWTFVLARYGSIGGPWVAALGLLWHALRPGASPNNRWRGP